jgi:FixJ family two-component response regulator
MMAWPTPTEPVKEILATSGFRTSSARANRREATEHEEFAVRYDTLTPREREVLALLVRGLLNKQAGFELGITEYTVQVHRAHIMRKMEARSFATLVRLAARFTVEAHPGLGQDNGEEPPSLRHINS